MKSEPQENITSAENPPSELPTARCSPLLNSSSLAGSVVRELDDHSLQGRRIGTSDADKLKMISELLRRKGDHTTSVKIIKRWISERGLF